MLGAIIGDIVGSRHEFHNHRSKDFVFFHPECRFTDDTVMTCAVAKALLDSQTDPETLRSLASPVLHEVASRYPNAGYGGRFLRWVLSDAPAPYHSFGNGAAMRVSPVARAKETEEEVRLLSRLVTEVTHDHPEGLKGAEAVALCIFLARKGKSHSEIREFVTRNYYPLDFSLAKIRATYSFDETCQGSVPQAITAYLEATGFEDAVRNAVSLGGDSDTIAAIAGSIAEAEYGIPDGLRQKALSHLDPFLSGIVSRFEAVYPSSGK